MPSNVQDIHNVIRLKFHFVTLIVIENKRMCFRRDSTVVLYNITSVENTLDTNCPESVSFRIISFSFLIKNED